MLWRRFTQIILMLLDMIQLMNLSQVIFMKEKIFVTNQVFSIKNNSNPYTQELIKFIKNITKIKSCSSSQVNSQTLWASSVELFGILVSLNSQAATTINKTKFLTIILIVVKRMYLCVQLVNLLSPKLRNA